MTGEGPHLVLPQLRSAEREITGSVAAQSLNSQSGEAESMSVRISRL